MPPQNKEAIVRPRTVTVQTTTDRRGERRYIVTGDEQLLPFGRYLQSELDRQEERERIARQRAENRMIERWARLYRVTNQSMATRATAMATALARTSAPIAGGVRCGNSGGQNFKRYCATTIMGHAAGGA